MKKGRFWYIFPSILCPSLALLGCVIASFFINRIAFYVELAVALLVFAFLIWRSVRMQYDIKRYLTRTAGLLNQADKEALEAFPLPVSVCTRWGST